MPLRDKKTAVNKSWLIKKLGLSAVSQIKLKRDVSLTSAWKSNVSRSISLWVANRTRFLVDKRRTLAELTQLMTLMMATLHKTNDLSAAFDTVDFWLQLSFGLDGPVLAWFFSYLNGRSQFIRRGMLKSPSAQFVCCVPQCSVYHDLVGVTEKHGVCPHLYADDTQIYSVSCKPSVICDFQQFLSACQW